jgi:flagellar basal body-associated protein FliL
MTWPVPDRPKLPPAPTREQKERARQAEAESRAADAGEELPRGIRRREDGSYATAYWRRDDVWIIGGMVVAILLLVAFLAYFTNFATHPSAGSAQRAADSLANSAQSSQGPLSPFWWVIAILIVGFVLAVVGYVVWALVSIFRAKGVGYDDVSAEEQARRREVARLLKQVEPAVTYDEAVLQLGHVAPEGPGQP